MRNLVSFDPDEIPLYREAIRTWIEGRYYGIDHTDDSKKLILCYHGDCADVTPFWNHFNKVKSEMKGQS